MNEKYVVYSQSYKKVIEIECETLCFASDVRIESVIRLPESIGIVTLDDVKVTDTDSKGIMRVVLNKKKK
jgi:hypothetical protein